MSAAPTGTVTFLFTDIEGSTRRWEQQAEGMKPALARHDEIVRAAIKANGGHVFKTGGDAFYAAFATASDAAAAALEAQRALAAESWGEVGELRVRMALHTGAVQQRDGDYFGPPLNRLARLLNAGHGGQTLLSLAAQELVRDHLPEGVQLRDLGAHRLRDLIRPEQIFQLIAPPLPSDFSPLKTLDARPHNLQTQPTPLLGREREVGQGCAQLRREAVRLLTLTGPGGTGKTRLALQVAADLLDDYKDGVYFVALAPLSDPALVGSTIAQTLGVKESGGRSIMQCLLDYLREKALLLVLDNFEQVTSAAPQVAELLANSPRLNVLVTSRIPLHVRGEHEFAVPPLALPDCTHLPALAALSQYAAVELFIERAQAVKSDFAVNNDNAPAVAEICVRLDGLPLAIELAAVRVKLLSPQAMLRRLDEPLKFLTGGARDLSARQQTLRAAIAWSYDLLDENEKRLFRRLAIFVGGFTLEAAAAVCDTNGDLQIDVFEGIAALVDESLLRQESAPDGEPRFFMLETIREYALERLTESGEELQRQHAEFFLNFAEQAEIELHGFQQLKWLERLEVEHDNLRAALGWLAHSDEAQRGLRLAGSLADFWNTRGHRTEAERQFGVLFALPGASQPTAARAKALCVGAGFSSPLDMRKAHSLLEESVQLWRELGDKRGLALATTNLGRSYHFGGERAKARALLERSAAISRELGDKWCLAGALFLLGEIALHQIDIVAAREAEEECIKLCREVGDRLLMAYALGTLGGVMAVQGEPEKDRSLHEESLAIGRELKDGFWIANCLWNLGCSAFSAGGYSAAAELGKATLEAYQQSGFKPAIAMMLFWVGEVAHRQGDEVRARSFYNDGLATARDSGDDDCLADALAHLGRVALDSDQAGEARRCYDECMAIRGKRGVEKDSWTLKIYGDLARFEGDSEQANRCYAESLELARECGDSEALGRLVGELGDVALDQSDYAKALGFWNEQMTIHRELEAKAGIAWSLTNFGLVAHYQGRYEEKFSLFEEALTTFRSLGYMPGVARSLLGCATVRHAQGDIENARALSEQSMAMFRRVTGAEGLGEGHSAGIGDVAYASQCFARVACAQGDIKTARAALNESAQIFRQTRDKRGTAECLAGFAKVAWAQSDAERAARLFGAAESLHKIVGPRLSPMDHHDHACVVAEVRRALADEAFAAAWAEGRAMTREQAVAYALEEAELS